MLQRVVVLTTPTHSQVELQAPAKKTLVLPLLDGTRCGVQVSGGTAVPVVRSVARWSAVGGPAADLAGVLVTLPLAATIIAMASSIPGWVPSDATRHQL